MNENEFFESLLRKSMRNILWFLAGLAACGLITIGMQKCSPKEDVTRDTVTMVKVKMDTLFKEKPVSIKEYIVRYARVARVNDSLKTEHETENVLSYSENINATDSITIPITQKEYRDSTYRVWVSGYMANLDSIEVYRRNVYTTQTITVRKKAPKVSLGVVGGYGYGLRSRQMEPFIGVGISWRFIPP